MPRAQRWRVLSTRLWTWWETAPTFSGAARSYAAVHDVASEAIVTEFDADAIGTVRAPELDPKHWRAAETSEWETSESGHIDGWDGPVRYRIIRYERI